MKTVPSVFVLSQNPSYFLPFPLSDGSLTLLVSIASTLAFLSLHFNGEYPISDARVISSLAIAIAFALIFIFVEIYVSKEAMLAPFLLRRRIPVLVGISWFLVATCNFSTMYFLPMWFETVDLTSTSTAGLHLLPNAAAMSIGSLFAGWMMQKTGKYRTLSLIFGIFPTVAALLIANLTPGSHPIFKWASIVPLGFGNAVVLQTSLIALLASLDPAHLAVGTGFTQLFRGIGQVWGVSSSSALFQSLLDRQLRGRITGPNADEIISTIRHSTRSVRFLDPETQVQARESYANALRAVFLFAAACTFTAFLVRLPIPELSLDHAHGRADPAKRKRPDVERVRSEGRVEPEAESEPELDTDEERDQHDETPPLPRPPIKRKRRLSTYASDDGMDPDD